MGFFSASKSVICYKRNRKLIQEVKRHGEIEGMICLIREIIEEIQCFLITEKFPELRR